MNTHSTPPSPKDRPILITGCSSGIGHCAAHALARRGYRVFATARREADVARLQEEGLEAVQLDLDDSASIRAALEQLLQATDGRLYGLFNNGAYGQPGAVEDLTRDVLRRQLETNLLGWLELTNQVIPVMRRQGEGRIVQNSSVLGLIALPFRGAYNCSKFALEGLTDTLRMELHGSGVQVSLIEPGPISSRFRANAHAALAAHVDRENSVFREQYAAAERRLTKAGPAAPFTLPPEAVVKKLIHALESPRPRARYYVTVPTYLFGMLRRVLPTRGLDRVLRGVSRGENR
ncbi:oxidoreductase [Ectothiorhodospira haloalkaliphila]|uniref:Oxidoreductase n=1 Tax=Ectothiorhodospira haloalkaliphila TaxID=421628 RepID=W8KIT8_9GAMM|nr:SDR family oxidoreductase [Ectothiorhodospira haloalkaliphila]AHK79669.1 oxidoreductase [Ectothiorhodospira haloalkaliphila]MCG5523890.1 SDR family oxidoreductase [Ectothiorhodospira haloalkaliphila]